jgi:hypothetical protein
MSDGNTNVLLEIIANELYIARLEREGKHLEMLNPAEQKQRDLLRKRIDDLRQDGLTASGERSSH